MSLHLPGLEQDLVKEEDPERRRYAAQNQTHNSGGDVQNVAILHELPLWSDRK
jgi:hypothetical protein